MTYTYDSRIVSDLYKDAYGFRPSVYYMVEWDKATPSRKQEIWDGLLVDLDASMESEKQEAARSVEAFEVLVNKSIALGAHDRQTALRWLTSEEHFEHEQAIEAWVWERGILFTDVGKATVQDLKAIWN